MLQRIQAAWVVGLSGLAWIVPVPATAQAQTLLEVSVSSPHAGEGSLRIALFRGPTGFPNEPIESAVLPSTAPDRAPETSHIEGETGPAAPPAPAVVWRVLVPAGVYAVAVVHDRNGNGRLDTNFLGMPREPYGFSQGARGRFGPPSFEDASFLADDPIVHVRVETR